MPGMYNKRRTTISLDFILKKAGGTVTTNAKTGLPVFLCFKNTAGFYYFKKNRKKYEKKL